MISLALLAWLAPQHRQKKAATESHDPPAGDNASKPTEEISQHYKDPTEGEHRAQEQAHWRREETEWKRQNIIEGGALFLSVVALAIASGGFYITAQIWHETVKTTADAHRQASAAEQGLPRGWLYVDFPERSQLEYSPDKQRFQGAIEVTVPIGIRNYGDVPATIIGFAAILFVADSSLGLFHGPFDERGAPLPDFLSQKAPENTGFNGTVIPKDREIFSTFPMKFWFKVPSLVAGAHRLIKVTVDYSDPHGDNRETCYFGDISFQAKEVKQVDCNYQR